jgi:hypothetical protein
VKVSRRAMVLGLGASLAARLAWADDVEGLLGRVARARAGVRTLRGPFTQTRRIGLLASDVRSRGHLVLVRPDRLRWELEPPDPVTFWVTPEGLSYRSAHGQGRLPPARSGLAAVLEDIGALLGGDLQSLRRRWLLRVVRDEADGAEIEVTPRAPAPAMLERMQIGLTADLALPRTIVLVEGPRDRTTIEFGALEVNAPIDDALMRP